MSRKRKSNLGEDDMEGYDSSFEDDESDAGKERKSRKLDLTEKEATPNIVPPSSSGKGLPSKEYFQRELTRAESYKNRYFALNAYERHRKLVNDYLLYHRGAAEKVLRRDDSKDKRDIDIIRENHRFLWDDKDDPDTWEKQLAKQYYNKLFKEYCICDLSRYKEKMVAMRWRTETELVEGKGQFACGARKCASTEGLRTWEVNFAYVEESTKKNALVKLRLCPDCSVKLNYGKKCTEIVKKSKKHSSSKSKKRGKDKRHSKSSKGRSSHSPEPTSSSSSSYHNLPDETQEEEASKAPENIWREPVAAPEMKSREEEFDEYLDDLFV